MKNFKLSFHLDWFCVDV